MKPHQLLSTPARRRAVLVVLVLVAVGGALAYGLAPDTVAGRLVPVLVMGGAVLAVLAVIDPDNAPDRPADGRADTWDTATGRAVLENMRTNNPALADRVEQVRANRRDTAPDTAAGAALPGGADAGWWDGLDTFGPGYAHGTVFVRTDPGGWAYGSRPAPVCPSCHMDRGISLVWLEDRPDLARLLCSCGTPWTHSAWCRGPGAEWALTQDEAGTDGHVRAGADVDPRLAYLAEMIRRQAGNTPRRRPDEA